MAAQELVTSIVLSVGASGALTGLVIWLFREWISARLKTSIQHEYDQKLEAHKARLKAENEVAFLQLKTEMEREAAMRAAAHASFAEGQKAAMERKLDSVDKLWNAVLTVRNNLPPILTFMDVLTGKEYQGVKNHPTYQAWAKDLSLMKIAVMASKLSEPIESIRPYVSEYLWALFFSYQATMIRLIVLFYMGQEDTSKIEWYKDQGIRQLMEAVMTPAELDEFDKTQFGKISWLQRRLESKVLGESRKIISGQEFGSESLEQARLIQQRATKVQADSVQPSNK